MTSAHCVRALGRGVARELDQRCGLTPAVSGGARTGQAGLHQLPPLSVVAVAGQTGAAGPLPLGPRHRIVDTCRRVLTRRDRGRAGRRRASTTTAPRPESRVYWVMTDVMARRLTAAPAPAWRNA